jgi:hypothetical protein
MWYIYNFSRRHVNAFSQCPPAVAVALGVDLVPMKPDSEEIASAYRNYTRAGWSGSAEEETCTSEYLEKWLRLQQAALPSGPLEKSYRRVISRLRQSSLGEHDEYENRLLRRRFNFQTTIASKKVSYRELSGMLQNNVHTAEVRKALLKEADELITSGLTDLIRARNQAAREEGFDDFWSWKNAACGPDLARILSDLDESFSSLSPQHPPTAPDEETEHSTESELVFYCSHVFANSEIPRVSLSLRTGRECPPGPPGLRALGYSPGEGHELGLNLPFVRNRRFSGESLGQFYHEITHLFHFASADSRGHYAFPPELAGNNLFYEAEALTMQNAMLYLRLGDVPDTDRRLLKDLVYVAETERLLYKCSPDISSLRSLAARRLAKHYPDGDFSRTPLGASHLIQGDLAGTYWVYPIARSLADKRFKSIATGDRDVQCPDYWVEGNEPSHHSVDFDALSQDDEVGAGINGTVGIWDSPIVRSPDEIRRELNSKGFAELL